MRHYTRYRLMSDLRPECRISFHIYKHRSVFFYGYDSAFELYYRQIDRTASPGFFYGRYWPGVSFARRSFEKLVSPGYELKVDAGEFGPLQMSLYEGDVWVPHETVSVKTYNIVSPYWVPIVLLLIYPAVAFMLWWRRRWRMRRALLRGRCTQCDYTWLAMFLASAPSAARHLIEQR